MAMLEENTFQIQYKVIKKVDPFKLVVMHVLQ